MQTPTLEVIGPTGGLFKITDHEGAIYRVPKISGPAVHDSSNGDSFRLDIVTPRLEITLLFPDAVTLDAFVAQFDAEH